MFGLVGTESRKANYLTPSDYRWIADSYGIPSWAWKDWYQLNRLSDPQNPGYSSEISDEDRLEGQLFALNRLIDRIGSQDYWKTYSGYSYQISEEDGTKTYEWKDNWFTCTFTISADGTKSEPKQRCTHPIGPLLPELFQRDLWGIRPFDEVYLTPDLTTPYISQAT